MVTEKLIEPAHTNPYDFREIYSQLRKRWIYYLISLLLITGIAFAVNTTSVPIYRVKSTIFINEDQNTPQTQMQPGNLLSGLPLFSTVRSFDNEIVIFKSLPIIESALKSLNYQVTYFERNYLGLKEIYGYSPFVVVFSQDHPQPVNLLFKVELQDNQSFRITAKGEDIPIYNYSNDKIINQVSKLKIDETRGFDDVIESEYYSFKIIANQNYGLEEGGKKKYFFSFNHMKKLAVDYATAIAVAPVMEELNLAFITLQSPSVNKSVDIINALTQEYVQRSMDKRNFEAVNTIQYIDNQLTNINDSLQNTEQKLQSFQSSNQVMDINLKSTRLYEQLRQLQTQKEQLDMTTKYYDYIRKYFDSDENISDLIAPSSMGIDDPLLNNMIQQLITLNNEKNTLIANNQEKSPYLRQLNIKIDNMKNTISENINYVLSTNDMTLTDINQRIRELNVEINKLPKTSRELIGIERKFNVNDAIYTYLLQRKAESEIAKASSLPNLEVIEPPQQEGDGPVAPKKTLNYIIAFVISLIIPTLFFSVSDYFNDYIRDEKHLERHLRYPMIGRIIHNHHKVDLVMTKFPNSSTSESIRHVRTNLPYFLKGKSHQVIMVSSSFGGEGKTFTALNIALSLALFGKKTLIIDFDMRKPRLTEIFSATGDKGISSLLIEEIQLEEVIKKQVIENLDFIPSGPIPPNPVELIAMENTRMLFSNLETRYDYVIVDSPPIGIVSDGYLLMSYSSLNLLVCRQDYTSMREFLSIQRDLTSKGITNLCVLLNDVTGKHGRYGYGYYTKEPGSRTKKKSA